MKETPQPTPRLYMQTTYVNETKGYQMGEEEPFPLDQSVCPTIPQVFKWARREYGRCQSKVYVDTPAGTIPCGWVFEKRRKYDDCKEQYLQHTWITILEKTKCECCNRPQFKEYAIGR